MNAAQRFFRKSLRATLTAVALYALLNGILSGIIALAVSRDDVFPRASAAAIAEGLGLREGEITLEADAAQALADASAWAMLLDDNGEILWQSDLPEALNRRYTLSDVARFSRWYLDDYPVLTWAHALGLLVIGYPPGSLARYSYTVGPRYYRHLAVAVALAALANLLLTLYLLLRNERRTAGALAPILAGIGGMARGEGVHLEERGELAPVVAALNTTSAQLQRKDAARADWIAGVSHDIRTPLSLILGYAGAMEEDAALPGEARAQASVIRAQGERLRQLVSDLNLASRLEYAMQPLTREPVNPAELARQCLSDLVNRGLDERYRYALEVDPRADGPILEGDGALLLRLMDNAVGNCIRHNPEGCEIQVAVSLEDGMCVLSVRDTGRGVSPALLERLNRQGDAPLSSGNNEIPHGNGLKLIRQIARAHGGRVDFDNAKPKGFCVIIRLPIQTKQ